MTTPLPNASAFLAQTVMQPGFSYLANNDAANLFNCMSRFQDLLIDPFRTGGGTYALELMTPIVTNRSKIGGLIELIGHFLQYGRKVIIYGPTIHATAAQRWADMDRATFASSVDRLFDWMKAYRGHPGFCYCGDGFGNTAAGDQNERLFDYLYVNGHSLMVEGRAWLGGSLYGTPSITMSTNAVDMRDGNPFVIPAAEPFKHGIYLNASGPGEPQMTRLHDLERMGHPVFYPAHEIYAGRLPLYLAPAPSDSGSNNGGGA